MKRLPLIICLTIAALTYVTRVSFASDLPACPSSGYFHNCFGSFSHEGRQYVGEWKDNLYNGQGTFTWENSDKYVGEFKDGKFNGQGTYTFGPNSEWAGEKYVGQWWNNKKNGRGTYTYANGDKYVGEFRDDKFNGHGTFTFGIDSDWAGDKYVGDFIDGKYNGQGTYTYADGRKDVGEFKDGKLNGYATLYSASGNILKRGIWKDDEFLNASNSSPISDADDVVDYSLLIEEDGDTFMHISQLRNGAKVGAIIIRGGYKWFEKTFNHDVSTRVFIQPFGLGEEGNYLSYTRDRYEINRFNSKFELNGDGDHILYFESREAIGKINSYIAKKEKFDIAALTPDSWYTGTFHLADNAADLVSLAKQNPDGFCFLLSLPMSSEEFNKQLQVKNLSNLMQENSVACDQYNNVIYIDKQNQTAEQLDTSNYPQCGPSHSIWNNCFGTVNYDSGNSYTGEWKNNKFNGQGTYTFANGSVYVGDHTDNKANGQGTYTFANGDKYVGEFKDDEFNGQGTFTFGPNSEWVGDKYVGEFKDSKRNGQGTYTYANGNKYVGEFKDGKFNGEGIKTYVNGRIEEGVWKDWVFQYAKKISTPDILTSNLPPCNKTSSVWNNCFSSHTFGNGDRYSGEWRENKLYGKGTYTFGPNSEWAGDRYVGELQDGIWNGQGAYTWSNGDKYVGEFRDGKRNGQGTYTHANGDKYVGDHKDGKADGFGTLTFGPSSNFAGDIYIGNFKDDKFNGQGTYTYVNGDQYVGEFKDDKHHGQGTYTFGPNSEWAGEKYVGEHKDGKYNGQGTYTYSNGDKYAGEYRDNKRNGQFTVTYTNGDKYLGEFKDDVRNGQGTYTFASGSKYVGEFKDGEYNGQGTYFWANGDKYTGEFKNNASNGTGVYIYADGSRLEGLWEDWKFQGTGDLLPTKPSSETRAEDTDIVSASSGSGFAVSSDGYVITNHHVIDGCQKVVVHTKENEFEVRIISYDPQNDLALLKGDFSPEKVFPLSNKRPELLQDIYVAGYPFGDMFSTSVKVTKGIISSLTGIGNNFSNIQIDAALQSGNSGGPILDDFGNVVGVAVSKLDAKYMFEELGLIPEDTNFGIKSNVLRNMLESNNIELPSENNAEISKSELGKMITDGTYYISCWMTMAKIEEMKAKKVFFNQLDQ